jgi:DNA-binding CsgD family transcriptional regulator
MNVPSLVGRDRERGQLIELLTSGQRGRSAALVIEGEPGVGKTALLDDAVNQAGGMTILRARGVQSEVDLPCGGVTQLVNNLTHLIPGLPEPQRNALQVALALKKGALPLSDKFAVGVALLSLLAMAAEEASLLAAVDDAHWLDRPTVEALHFVARRLGGEGVVLLVASRDVDRGAQWFADVPRMRLIGLEPLAAREVLARHGAVDLNAERLDQLVRATNGNPLALIELPRLMAMPELAGAIPEHEPPPIGSLLQTAYGQRLASLPESSRDALLVVALLDSADRRVVDASLRALSLTVDDLTAAEEAGLVSFTPEGLIFRHPLVRSAVVQAAPPKRCRQAHGAAAMALEASALIMDQTRRAWHAAAAVTGLNEDAARLLDQAALHALQIAGHSSAYLAWERAADLTPRGPDRTRRLLRAAESAYHAGIPQRARLLLDQVDQLDLNPEARCQAARTLGQLETWDGHPLDAYRQLTEAASSVSDEHPLQAARLLMEATVSAVLAGSTDEALAAATSSHRLAEGRDNKLALISQLTIGGVHITRGESATGLAMINLDDALIAFACGDPDVLPFLNALAFCRLMVDQFEAADRLSTTVVEHATRSGAVGLMPFAVALRATIEYRRGSMDAAHALAHEAMRLARDTGRVNDLVMALNGAARVEASRGQTDECRRHVAEAVTLAAATGARATEAHAHAITGLLELGLGRPDRAVSPLERARHLCTELGLLEFAHWQWAPELCEAYVRLGRRADAEPIAELLDWHARRTDRAIAWALAAHCRGLLAPEGAFEHAFEIALRWHAQAARPFERARTQLCFGERLRRAKQRAKAREQLHAAWKVFIGLGAHPWEERCRAEIAASGLRLAPARQSPADLLTPQELQVALTVAAGATNRETARRLFIAPKTVEYHLRHVYEKLGTCRQELQDLLNIPARVPHAPSIPEL